MMCSDRGAIDHVGGGIAPRQLAQSLKHGSKHACRNPSSIRPENAVPLAILIRHVPPPRANSRGQHYAFKIGTVILCRTAAATEHFPFLVCNANTLAQGYLQKPALNQGPRVPSQALSTKPNCPMAVATTVSMMFSIAIRWCGDLHRNSQRRSRPWRQGGVIERWQRWRSLMTCLQPTRAPLQQSCLWA